MTEDNAPPPEEGHIAQARRLAEQALAAQRAGDQETADRLFDEAARLDPHAVEDVLEQNESLARPRR